MGRVSIDDRRVVAVMSRMRRCERRRVLCGGVQCVDRLYGRMKFNGTARLILSGWRWRCSRSCDSGRVD